MRSRITVEISRAKGKCVGLTRSVVHFVGSADCGGTEQALLHLVAGLNRQGWRQVVLHHPEPRLLPLLNGAHQFGVGTRSVPRTTNWGSLWRLVEAVRSEQPAIFHAHLNWPMACRTGLVVAAALGVRARVATLQLIIGGPWPVQGRLQRFVIAPLVGRFIAVSHGVAGELRASFGVPCSKLRVVHNGLPEDGFQDVAPIRLAEPPVVMTTARLDPQKGLPVLLEAAASLPGVSFIIAGDGPEGPALARRARALGVHDRVRFLGHRHDIQALLAGCEAFALPSMNEGLPLAILEAMAAARPVIASAIPGISEAVVDGETGLLFPPGDSAALADAIRAVLADSNRAAQLGAAGRRRARQEFSADAMVRGVAAVYDELLTPRAPRKHIS